MRRPASLPVLIQVAALAVAAVLASQAVAVAVLVLSPPPPPRGFSIAAAAQALQGLPARAIDGRPLKRRLSERPPEAAARVDPMEDAIAVVLAQSLGAPPASVRVSVQQPGRPSFPGRPGFRDRPPPPPAGRVESTVVVRRDALGGGGAGRMVVEAETRVEGRGPPPDGHPLDFFADRLAFGPFTASLKLDDGRWATVEPPRGWLSPWQERLLLTLALSLLVLAPLVWWFARRLTRPIRAFAAAAERLGADPEAEPLVPAGPTEVRTAIAAFNGMQASIKAHMRRRTQTVAAIAHDLRTPLTRLRFRAEQAPEALRAKMAADVEEMDHLIGQAMAFARGDEGVERREPLDLAAIAADCAHDFADTGAEVVFAGAARLPIQGDPVALRRTVGNLIDNAVKFAGAARVTARRKGDLAIVEIADDGPGLPEEALETVFEPFERLEPSRNRRTGGSGLGLAVARQAARAHGGEVALENRPGGGLTARLSLPTAGGKTSRG